MYFTLPPSFFVSLSLSLSFAVHSHVPIFAQDECDTDHDGTLSQSELSLLFANPDIVETAARKIAFQKRLKAFRASQLAENGLTLEEDANLNHTMIMKANSKVNSLDADGALGGADAQLKLMQAKIDAIASDTATILAMVKPAASSMLTTALPTTPPPQRASVVKGICAVCGNPVLNTHQRNKNDAGAYFHTTPADCA
jgi:hypothetical protein